MDCPVNLIPHTRVTRRRRARCIARWSVAAGASLTLAGVFVGAARVSFMVDTAALDRERAALGARINDLIREIPAQERTLADVEHRLRVADRLADRPDWSLLLALLDHERGRDVRLVRCEVVPLAADGRAPRVGSGAVTSGPVRLTINGLATSQGDVAAFLLGLEGTGLFADASLGSTRRTQTTRGDRIEFELVCRFGAGETGAIGGVQP